MNTTSQRCDRHGRCEPSLPPVLTIRMWQHGWRHERTRAKSSSFAGVVASRRMRGSGSSKWKIGWIGAAARESKLRTCALGIPGLVLPRLRETGSFEESDI